MTQSLLMTQSPLESQTEILEEIVGRFAPKNHMEGGTFTPQTHLVDDVGIDSASIMDVVLEIEDRFGFTIEINDMQRVKTFGDLRDLVSSRVVAGQ